jgi:hypothetical protein
MSAVEQIEAAIGKNQLVVFCFPNFQSVKKSLKRGIDFLGDVVHNSASGYSVKIRKPQS